jgi:hypothetical protein
MSALQIFYLRDQLRADCKSFLPGNKMKVFKAAFAQNALIRAQWQHPLMLPCDPAL